MIKTVANNYERAANAAAKQATAAKPAQTTASPTPKKTKKPKKESTISDVDEYLVNEGYEKSLTAHKKGQLLKNGQSVYTEKNPVLN